jgi:hypothetical protein
MALAAVDLSEHQFRPICEMVDCDHPATVIAKGCMDKAPVVMCDQCFDRGIELVKSTIRMYQRSNKRVLVCGDCHRPILRLDTHIDVSRLP